MIEDCCPKEHGLGTLVAEIGARSTEVDEVWLCSVLPLQELNVHNYTFRRSGRGMLRICKCSMHLAPIPRCGCRTPRCHRFRVCALLPALSHHFGSMNLTSRRRRDHSVPDHNVPSRVYDHQSTFASADLALCDCRGSPEVACHRYLRRANSVGDWAAAVASDDG